MSVRIEPLESLPEKPRAKRERKSQSQELVDAALNSPHGVIRVDSDDPEELTRVYKALLQWATRHGDVSVGIRKDGSGLYIWKGEPGTLELQSGGKKVFMQRSPRPRNDGRKENGVARATVAARDSAAGPDR